jgi:hypothetical protein
VINKEENFENVLETLEWTPDSFHKFLRWILVIFLGATVAWTVAGCTVHKELMLLSENNAGVWKENGTGWGNQWQMVGQAWLDRNGDSIAREQGKGTLYYSKSKSGSMLVTNREHGDCVLHAEVLLGPDGETGIYMQGRYEIELLDSYEQALSGTQKTMGAITCGIGEGSVVEGLAPSYNAANPAGSWNMVDIQFQAARFNWLGKKTKPAMIKSVRINGVEVQRNIELKKASVGAIDGKESSFGPLVLAGKGSTVAFRNVVMRYSM